MKNKILISLLSFFLITISYAKSQTGSSNKVAKYVSNTGKFKIQFPVSNPTTNNQDINLGENLNSTLYTFSYESSTVLYMVSYNDYPQEIMKNLDVKESLNGAEKGFNKSMELTSYQKSNINIEKNRKKYSGIFYKSSGKGKYVAVKVFLIENRLYQLAIMNMEGVVAQKDINDFLNSFEIF